MDNVRCFGNETRLIDCKFDGWARHDCAEQEDAGVQCAQDTSPRAKIAWNPLRLDYTKAELEKLARVGRQEVHSPTAQAPSFEISANLIVPTLAKSTYGQFKSFFYSLE